MSTLKDINYDLVKLLHAKLDVVHQLEKCYIEDAKQAKCHSLPALQQILHDERKHVDMLISEIKMRMDAGVFD